MVLLALWLAWAGLGLIPKVAAKRDEPTPNVTKQAVALGAMLLLGVGLWFVFGLDDKLDFDRPLLLLIALGAVPIFVLGAVSLQQLEPPRRWSAVYLRLMLLFLVVVMLAGFRTVQRHDELTVVALIDTSDSIKRFARPPGPPENALDESGQPLTTEQWVRRYLLQAAQGGQQGDAFGVQVFDGRPTVRSRPSLGDPAMPDGVVEQPYDGTNAQRAIESGMAAKQSADSALRLVLVSDGNFTDGSAMEAARAAAAAGIPIDVLPVEYQIENEVMVEGVYVPSEAREGQTVPVEVVLRGTAAVDGFIQLRHNNQTVDLNGPDVEGTGRAIPAERWRRVNRDADDAAGGDTGFGDYILRTYIDRPMTDTGVNRYEVVFQPADQTGAVNTVVANDKAEAFTLVAGQGRVLVVDGVGGEPGRILPRALASHGVQLDIVDPSGMPRRPVDMQRYDAIILQNVPAETVPPVVQENLAQYVHDFGGGFMMVGGPDSFGAGGWTNTPIDKYILPVACQIPSQVQLPSGALVLVIDRSGSMFGNVGGSSLSQQNVASEAAVLALSTLYPQDLVGVVAFDTSAHWLVKLGPNSDPGGTAQRVRSMQPGGGTDINAGVQAAVQALANSAIGPDDAAIKHIIVITDGHGAMPNMLQLGQTLGHNNITISTVGVGDGHNDQGLRNLAQTGQGQFYPVSDPNNLPQVFIKEARMIRKNLIRELLFTPGLRNTGSPIIAGIDALPPLHGFVLTGPKRDPRIMMPIVGPEGEPIFAHHQVGLGRAAAFTADAHNRWGQDWLGWGGYEDFWNRTIRQISRPPASMEADLSTRIEGDTLVLRLDAAGDLDFDAPAGGAGAAFGNNLTVRGAVTRPDGSVGEVELQQVGPGLYEARVPANESGNYIADLQMISPDGDRRRVIGGTTSLAGGELRTFTSNRAALQEIADLTGGRVLDPLSPEAAGLFDRDQPFESVSTRPLRWQLMPLLLLILLMDVACRRIAWDAREIGGWAKGRMNTIAGTMSARKVEGESTMAALKAKRAATSAQLNQPQAVPERSEGADGAPGLGGLASRVKQNAQATADGKPAPAPQKPAKSRTRKFVASEEDLAKASDDFAAAVGGAKEGVEAKPIVSAAQRKSEKDQGPTTSRLLDAKRRAQQRLNEDDE